MKIATATDFLIFSLPERRDWTRFMLQPSGKSEVLLQPFTGNMHGYEVTAESTFQWNNIVLNLSSPSETGTTDRTSYEKLIAKAIRFCEGHQRKVVCSRAVHIEGVNPADSIASWLQGMRAAFPKAFVYLLQTKNDGVWLGATPETLVKKDGAQFKTMSVAGTKWYDKPFGEKEFREQQIVTDAILSDLGLDASSAGQREEVAFGKIRHLRTGIEWPANYGLIEAAAKLHPTPAVCGWPKTEARQFILENEPYDRRLYTGFIGLQTKSHQVAFVNLRCMQLFRNSIQVYVGGGVNSLSEPKVEWEETQHKLQTLLDAMKIDA